MVRTEGAEPPSPLTISLTVKRSFLWLPYVDRRKDKISHAYKVKKTKWSSPSQAFEEKDKSWKYDPTIGARQNCWWSFNEPWPYNLDQEDFDLLSIGFNWGTLWKNLCPKFLQQSCLKIWICSQNTNLKGGAGQPAKLGRGLEFRGWCNFCQFNFVPFN